MSRSAISCSAHRTRSPDPGSLRLLCCVLIACLLSSCFDSRQEVWINPDASGRARLTLDLPSTPIALYGGESAVRAAIETALAGNPSISSHQLILTSGNGRFHLDLLLTFPDLRKLSETGLSDLPPPASTFAGTMITKFKGLGLVVSRITDLSELPGTSLVPSALLENRAITTILHLPEAATSSDATTTSNQGKTLVWHTPLARALRQPVSNSFTMPLPIPWRSISLFAVPLLLLTSAAACLILRKNYFTRPG